MMISDDASLKDSIITRQKILWVRDRFGKITKSGYYINYKLQLD